MNVVVLMGRLCRDPEIRRSQGGDREVVVGNYTLAVDRRMKKDGEQSADFIRCVMFGKSAEFAEKHLRKGMKMIVRGRIQTGSYTDRDGVKHYTTDVIVDELEFAESKGKEQQNSGQAAGAPDPKAAGTAGADDGFMAIPDAIEGEELPF